jgi:hypothetical protein
MTDVLTNNITCVPIIYAGLRRNVNGDDVLLTTTRVIGGNRSSVKGDERAGGL